MSQLVGHPFTLLSALLLAGCGRQSDVAEAPTPSVRMPSQSLQDPLTEAEVRTFLAVLDDLPGRKVPEFEPLSQVTASDRLRAAQLAGIYRQEYRAMFDASRHGERWRKDAALMSAFKRHQIEPEDFASLMIRMSCTVAAGAVSSRVNLAEAAERAETQLAEVIRRMKPLDSAARTPTVIEHRRQALVALQDLVALSEFSRILAGIPQESRDLIAKHRDALARHLPAPDNIEMFERVVESEVVPTSFEQTRSGHDGSRRVRNVD